MMMSIISTNLSSGRKYFFKLPLKVFKLTITRLESKKIIVWKILGNLLFLMNKQHKLLYYQLLIVKTSLKITCMQDAA